MSRRPGIAGAIAAVAVLVIAGSGWALVRSTSAPQGSSLTVTTLGLHDAKAQPHALGLGQVSFASIDCPNSQECIAVGQDASGDGSVGVSRDGGVTWSTNPAPTGSNALSSVSCPSESRCVAVGDSTAIVTSDAGSTWHLDVKGVPSSPILAVGCATSTQCVTAGYDPSTAGGARGEILRSQDGGVSWRGVHLPGAALGLGGVTCPTPTRCIAVGDSIFVTNDAGTTWTPATLSDGFTTLSSVSCTSDVDCVAVGPNARGTSDPSAPANGVVTHDGGATWDPMSMPVATSSVRTISCTTSKCFATGAAVRSGTGPVLLARRGATGSFSIVSAPRSMTALAQVVCLRSKRCLGIGAVGTTPAIAVRPAPHHAWVVRSGPTPTR